MLLVCNAGMDCESAVVDLDVDLLGPMPGGQRARPAAPLQVCAAFHDRPRRGWFHILRHLGLGQELPRGSGRLLHEQGRAGADVFQPGRRGAYAQHRGQRLRARPGGYLDEPSRGLAGNVPTSPWSSPTPWRRRVYGWPGQTAETLTGELVSQGRIRSDLGPAVTIGMARISDGLTGAQGPCFSPIRLWDAAGKEKALPTRNQVGNAVFEGLENCGGKLVELAGIEPATSSMPLKRSPK